MAACITNEAYETAAREQRKAIITQASIDAAIQIVVALWQRKSSSSIANMQQEIADQQIALAEEVEAHAEIFWPEEKELVDDTFGQARVTTNYTSMMAEFGGLAQSSLQDGRQQWITRMRAMCMAPSRCEDARWQRNAALLNSDLQNYAARQDESRTQILNDRRYARQYAVLGMGRGSLQEFLSYQRIGGAIATNAGNMLVATVNSALQAYGYFQTRREPVGWGSAIRDQWTKTYMPSAAAPTTANSWGAFAPNAVQPLEPIARPSTVVREITKETEFEVLPEAMAEQYRMRTPGGLQ